MTSPLDLVTGGMGQMSGLSLVTGGLLVLTDLPPAAGESAVRIQPKIDARLVFDRDNLDADVHVLDGDLEPDNSLQTAILLSLFTDRRATPAQLERFGARDPRGWWGDADAEIPGDAFGSHLWLLERELATAETLNRAREYARQALAWLITDGIAASITVEAEYPQPNMLALGVSAERASRATERFALERFAFVWEV